jgi:glycosyltransferase involved in cell wall biosynthesis
MTLPTVTIIIPTYNRPQRLRQCLESLLHLNYPRDLWDVIVVNDGGAISFDGLEDDFLTQLPIQLLAIENTGPATARNYGVNQAIGEYIAFTDDDCEVQADWLSSAVETLQSTEVHAVGGTMINAYPDSIAAETWQMYIGFLQAQLRTIDDQPLLLPSNNIIYHRLTFAEIGGFNETFPLPAAEDFEIGYRIIAGGYSQMLTNKMTVIHHHRSTPIGYLMQHFRYGRGAYYMGKVMAQDERLQQVQLKPRPKGKFFLDLGLHLWNIHAPIGMWLLIILTPIIHRLGRTRETLFPIKKMI